MQHLTARAVAYCSMIPTPSLLVRKRCVMAPPLSVARLNEVDQYVAFCVHSNSIDVLGDDVDARGPLGYFGTPAVREARLIQLAWASAAPGEERAGTREQRYVAIPGVVDGGVLGDVLLRHRPVVARRHYDRRIRPSDVGRPRGCGRVRAASCRRICC